MRQVYCLASVLALGCGLAESAHAGRAKLIDTFPTGGYYPDYGLTATQGALYGVTSLGNSQDDACGTVFQLVRHHGQWASTTLHSFSCGNGSGEPNPLTVDGATGDVWGSISSGSYGVVFRLVKPHGAGEWAYETIYQFQGGTDGNLNSIQAPLLLQGGAAFGMADAANNGSGADFYSLTNNGSTWQKTTLATIANLHANAIVGFDAAGAVYISANQAGAASHVYQLVPQQGGSWTVTSIAQFNLGHVYGSISNLVLDGTGNVFGLEARNIKSDVFELMPPTGGGTKWTKSIIADPSRRRYGLTSLALGLGGDLVGTIYGDQDSYGGAAIAMTPPTNGGTTWTSTVLWDFSRRGPDSNPLSINVGPYGNYYGTMNNTYDNGAVYELKR